MAKKVTVKKSTEKMGHVDREIFNRIIRDVARGRFENPQVDTQTIEGTIRDKFSPEFTDKLVDSIIRMSEVYAQILASLPRECAINWLCDGNRKALYDRVYYLGAVIIDKKDIWMVWDAIENLHKYYEEKAFIWIYETIQKHVREGDLYDRDDQYMVSKKVKDILLRYDMGEIPKYRFAIMCHAVNDYLDKLEVKTAAKRQREEEEARKLQEKIDAENAEKARLAEEKRQKEKAQKDKKYREKQERKMANRKKVLGGPRINLPGGKFAFTADSKDEAQFLDEGTLVMIDEVVYRRTKRGFEVTDLVPAADTKPNTASSSMKLVKDEKDLPENLSERWLTLKNGNTVKVLVVPTGYEKDKRLGKSGDYLGIGYGNSWKVYKVFKNGNRQSCGDARPATRPEVRDAKSGAPKVVSIGNGNMAEAFEKAGKKKTAVA